MSQKRIRSINWDEEEKQLFRSVFKEYAQIIENKSLDTNTNKIKTKAWEQFHYKFNQLNGRPRELSQLKIQWKTMKVNARKTYNAFKKETNKTGGGTRPPTPNDTIIEIKDLLNPAELLRDDNLYDSDGVIVGNFEFPTNNDTNYNNTHNIACVETIEDVHDQESCQILTPVGISQEKPKLILTNCVTPMEIKLDSVPVKINNTQISEDKAKETPMNNRGITPAKKVAKRKINLNNIMNSSTNSKKNHEDYVNSMINHSRMLKDEEHMRRMEMIEEEHAIKMEIHRETMKIQKEKLKSAILEREILELKKQCNSLLNKIISS